MAGTRTYQQSNPTHHINHHQPTIYNSLITPSCWRASNSTTTTVTGANTLQLSLGPSEGDSPPCPGPGGMQCFLVEFGLAPTSTLINCKSQRMFLKTSAASHLLHPQRRRRLPGKSSACKTPQSSSSASIFDSDWLDLAMPRHVIFRIGEGDAIQSPSILL